VCGVDERWLNAWQKKKEKKKKQQNEMAVTEKESRERRWQSHM